MSRRLGKYLDPIMNVGGVQFPVKRGTWDFIEQAYSEQLSASIISAIGVNFDATKVYVLYGVVVGISTTTAGAIFYVDPATGIGEIYLVAAHSNITPFPLVVVGNLSEVSWQPTDAVGNHYADPVAFIGAAPSNVHIIRTCVFAAGASGSGTISGNTSSDFSNMIYLDNFKIICFCK